MGGGACDVLLGNFLQISLVAGHAETDISAQPPLRTASIEERCHTQNCASISPCNSHPMTDRCEVWKPNLFILCLDNSESDSHSTATYDVGSTLQPHSSLCPFLPAPLCQMMLIPGALWNSHLLHTPLCLRISFPGHSACYSLCQEWVEKADTKMGILELDPLPSS